MKNSNTRNAASSRENSDVFFAPLSLGGYHLTASVTPSRRPEIYVNDNLRPQEQQQVIRELKAKGPGSFVA